MKAGLKLFIRLLTVLSIFLGLCLPVRSVRAQISNEVVFDKVQVNIWPEYDRAGVLVIYRMTLAAATSLPAQVTVRIPISAEKPYNLAMRDVDGLLYNLDYTLADDGGCYLGFRPEWLSRLIWQCRLDGLAQP